ncbi:MAG: hypothetical protein WA865_13300 [Spirulinaceae cyanobacterium]
MSLNTKNDCCFSALALSPPYWNCAGKLAKNLTEFAPGIKLVVATDNVSYFKEFDNVIAIPHRHYFGYRPYNDKLFAIDAALQRFSVVVQVDVDITFLQPVETLVNENWQLGITGRSESLVEHTRKYNPKTLIHLEKICDRLDLELDSIRWIGESLFVIRRDSGKEQKFLACWRKLAHYWDIHKLGAGEGAILGLAAAYVGWEVEKNEHWTRLNSALVHQDIHKEIVEPQSAQLKRKWYYRLRILRSKLLAIQDRDFYQ